MTSTHVNVNELPVLGSYREFLRPSAAGNRRVVEELVRWASYLGDAPFADDDARQLAVGALTDVAGGDGDLLQRAWLLGVRQLAYRDVTPTAVELLRSACEQVPRDERT